jgi:hypothetical protein
MEEPQESQIIRLIDPGAWVNKITYDREYISSMAENGYPPLEEVTLEDGGKISGFIVFSVPDGTNEYAFKYKQWSWDDYEIRWKE